MAHYYVYRIGSNSANQSMTHETVVSIIEAEDFEAAEEIVAEEQRLGKYTVYANQHLSIIAEEDLDEMPDDLEIIDEEEAMRNQIVPAYCQICGKLVGEQEAWQAANAYCGCRG